MKIEIRKIIVYSEKFEVDTVIINTIKTEGKEKESISHKTFTLKLNPCRRYSAQEIIRKIAKWMYENKYENKGDKRRCSGSYLMNELKMSEEEYQYRVYLKLFYLTSDVKKGEIFRLYNRDDLEEEDSKDLRDAFGEAFFQKEEGKKKSDSSYYWLGDYRKTKIKFSSELKEISNLPILYSEIIKDFIGREYVYNAFDEFIKKEDCGYFTIVGDPGEGKSAILAEYVKRNECVFYFNNHAIGLNKPWQCIERFVSN